MEGATPSPESGSSESRSEGGAEAGTDGHSHWWDDETLSREDSVDRVMRHLADLGRLPEVDGYELRELLGAGSFGRVYRVYRVRQLEPPLLADMIRPLLKGEG